MLTGQAIDSETIILVVENDDDDRRMLKQICRDVGFTLGNIREVNSLEQAKPLMNRGEVDLVLLDLALDDGQNPMPAVDLLETWTHEAKRKGIPVIVVSGFIEVVKAAAQAPCAAVIRKPGPTDREIAQFTNFLQHVIKCAISRRSGSATLWDRVSQQLDRLMSRIVPGRMHVHVGPGVTLEISSKRGRAAVWCFVLCCYGVTLYAIANNRGWPIMPVMASFGALLALVLSLMLMRRKRAR